MSLVFEQSDPSTLAALGTVSMDVPEATGPILYRRVEVTSIGGLNQLFCEREEESESSPPSRINHLLTLSQIKTFHVNLLYPELSYARPRLSVARVASSTPIPLDLLQISSSKYENADAPYSKLHAYLLPHLDPVRVEYNTHKRSFQRSSLPIVSSLPPLSTFRRLKTLDVKGSLPIFWNHTASHLANLPIPTLARRRTVRLHIATLISSHAPDVSTFLEKNKDVGCFHLDCMQDGSLVLVVRTEEGKREAEEAVAKLAQGKRIKFMVELEA